MIHSPAAMAAAPDRQRATRHMDGFCHRRGGARRGFSLVEVVLALGVTAFALVSVLGLLPVALNAAGDAMETSRVASIIQVVGSDLAQEGHTRLKSQTQPVRYFDFEGVELSADQDSYFQVNVVVDDQFVLPGATTPSSHLLLAHLEISMRGTQQPVRAVVSVPDMGR